MGETTAISWTDHTFNPWWGCARVSPGCQNCYAEAFAKRTGKDVWGKTADRRRFGDKHWNEPLKWDRAAKDAGKPALVFCASMADVFEDREDHWPDRLRLWDLITRTPDLEWQLLTKRPENVRAMVPAYWLNGHWPPNVWIGTTVEDQQRADERIPHLLDLPAGVRFLSMEPLLGTVWIDRYLYLTGPSTAGPFYDFAGRRRGPAGGAGGMTMTFPPSGDIGWVIVGGESGPGHRPLDLEAADALRNQCEEARVPFFFKQVGGRYPTSGGDLLDGRQHKAFPARAQRG